MNDFGRWRYHNKETNCALQSPEEYDLLSNHGPIFLYKNDYLKVECKLFLACNVRV